MIFRITIVLLLFFSTSLFASDKEDHIHVYSGSSVADASAKIVDACNAEYGAACPTGTPSAIPPPDGLSYVAHRRYRSWVRHDTGAVGKDTGTCTTSNSTYSWSCHFFVVYSDLSCPAGKSADSVTGECIDQPCVPGSLKPECAVNCPAIEYTYYLDGILRRGRIGAGQVGYGQTCPQPSFPAGSSTGCVGDVGSCTNWEQGTNEGETVQETTTETSADGSESTSTTKTQGGQDSTGGANGGSSDGSVIDTYGNPLAKTDEFGDNNYEDTINIGDKTFGRCAHGGLVDGTVGCDYNPPACASNQVAINGGCVTIPQSDPPETPPTDKTQTTTNPDGSTTTKSTSTTGSTGGKESEEKDNPKVREASVSGNCTAAPSCTGDGIDCAVLLQEWRASCSLDDSVKNETDCNTQVECVGDPIACAVLTQNQQTACELRNNTKMIEGVSSVIDSNNLTTAPQIEAAAAADGYVASETVDVSDILAPPTANTPGSCPANFNISLLGASYTVDMGPVCNILTYIGYLVRLTAAFLYLNLVYRALGEL